MLDSPVGGARFGSIEDRDGKCSSPAAGSASTQQISGIWDDLPVLSQLVNSKVPGREDQNAITCFCNNVGLGLQFAAVGSEVLLRAREARVGREVPTDWFLESVHP